MGHAGREFMKAEAGEAKPADLQSNEVVFLFIDLPHNEVVSKRQGFGEHVKLLGETGVGGMKGWSNGVVEGGDDAHWERVPEPSFQHSCTPFLTAPFAYGWLVMRDHSAFWVAA